MLHGIRLLICTWSDFEKYRQQNELMALDFINRTDARHTFALELKTHFQKNSKKTSVAERVDGGTAWWLLLLFRPGWKTDAFKMPMLSKADAFSIRAVFDSADVRPGTDILGRTSSRCQVVVDPVCQAMIDPVSGESRSDVDCETDGVVNPLEAPFMTSWQRLRLTTLTLEKAEKSSIKVLRSILSNISFGLKWNIKQPKWIKYLKFSRLQTVIEFSFDWTLCIKNWMLFKIL